MGKGQPTSRYPDPYTELECLLEAKNERIAELEVAVAQQAINMVELASFKEMVVALAHHWDSSGQFDELVEIIQAHKE